MQVSSRYCEQCGIKISLEDIKQENFFEYDGNYYCIPCRDDLFAHTSPLKNTKSSPRSSRSPTRIYRSSDRTKTRRPPATAPTSTESTSSTLQNKQLWTFAAIAGSLGLVMLFLLGLALSQNTKKSNTTLKNSPKNTTSKPTTNPQEIEYQRLQKRLQQKFPLSRKLALLLQFYRRYKAEGFLPKIEKELKQNIAKLRYLKTKEETQKRLQNPIIGKYAAARDNIYTWQSTLTHLKNTPWEKKVQSHLQKLYEIFWNYGQQKFDKLLQQSSYMLAKAESIDEIDFDSAQRKIEDAKNLWEEIQNNLPKSQQKQLQPLWQKLQTVQKKIKKWQNLEEEFQKCEIKAEEAKENYQWQKAIDYYKQYEANTNVELFKRAARNAILQLKQEWKNWKNEQKNIAKNPTSPSRNSPSLLPPQNKWIPLFDGIKLAPHRLIYAKPENWTTTGGLLRAKGEPNQLLSAIIFTQYQFKNFILEFSAKILQAKGQQGTAFGIYVRGEARLFPPLLYKNRWLHIQVKVEETNFTATVIIQGQSFPIRAPQLRHAFFGKVGFVVTTNSQVQLKNIRIKALPTQ